MKKKSPPRRRYPALVQPTFSCKTFKTKEYLPEDIKLIEITYSGYVTGQDQERYCIYKLDNGFSFLCGITQAFEVGDKFSTIAIRKKGKCHVVFCHLELRKNVIHQLYSGVTIPEIVFDAVPNMLPQPKKPKAVPPKQPAIAPIPEPPENLTV